MEPRLLLKALMNESGHSPSSLARIVQDPKVTQPQIHKFIEGKAREPRRAFLEPIAAHYRIPVDALYHADAAERVARELGIDPIRSRRNVSPAGSPKIEEPPPPYGSPAAASPTPLERRIKWPFKKVSYRRVLALPPSAQAEIDAHLEFLVQRLEAKHPAPTKQTAR